MDELDTATGRAEAGLDLQASPDLGIQIHSAPAGVITMAPQPDHVISIFMGAPVRVACRYAGRTHRRLQAHGDIDIVPAGVGGAWEDESAATALVVRISPTLLNA